MDHVLDQVHVVDGLSGSLGVLKSQLQRRGVLVSLKHQGVVVASKLQHLGEVGDVNSERLGGIGAEGLKTVGRDVERHQGDVGGVHSLDGETVVGDVDVYVVDEVFDGLHDFLQNACFA